MQVINKTSLPISLNDLLNKREWKVEYGTYIKKVTVIVSPLNDWKVIVQWLNGKHPYRGFCSPKDKLILIAVNPKNKYPFHNRNPHRNRTSKRQPIQVQMRNRHLQKPQPACSFYLPPRTQPFAGLS